MRVRTARTASTRSMRIRSMNADGRIDKVIEYCIDITDRRKAEEDKKKMDDPA